MYDVVPRVHRAELIRGIGGAVVAVNDVELKRTSDRSRCSPLVAVMAKLSVMMTPRSG